MPQLQPPGAAYYASSGGTTISTQTDWAHALLGRLGFPVTDRNVQNLVAWQTAEGTFQKGWMNPLDTTQHAPGSRSVNSVGVQAYPSWDIGLDATTKTLNNGRYGTILADLRGGNVDVQSFAAHVRATPWGSSTFRPSGTPADPSGPVGPMGPQGPNGAVTPNNGTGSSSAPSGPFAMELPGGGWGGIAFLIVGVGLLILGVYMAVRGSNTTVVNLAGSD